MRQSRRIWAHAIRAVAVAGWLASAPAFAAYGVFADIPGIPGDATFPPATNQIQAISFTWNVHQLKSTRLGTAGVCSAGRTKPVFDQLCLVKHADKASPKLFLAAMQGTDFAKITISFYDLTQPSNPPYDVYELSHAIVSTVQTSHQGGDEIPTESVCFNFDQVKTTVNAPNPAGGPVDTVTATFNACTRDVQ
jgi:type VI protein secretion system component Hcp